jgi:Tfp pilus assembly protein PilX
MYGLPERSTVRITVYSVLGREITTLVDEDQQAGTYKIRWVIPQNGLASGVYYYRIEATGLESAGERFVRTKSMVVIQ